MKQKEDEKVATYKVLLWYVPKGPKKSTEMLIPDNPIPSPFPQPTIGNNKIALVLIGLNNYC